MDSIVDCAQAHCVKKDYSRAPCTWLNGLLPLSILCAILVTILTLVVQMLKLCTFFARPFLEGLMVKTSTHGRWGHTSGEDVVPLAESNMSAMALTVGSGKQVLKVLV